VTSSATIDVAALLFAETVAAGRAGKLNPRRRQLATEGRHLSRPDACHSRSR